MLDKKKSVEYYFDSKLYKKEDIMKKLQETQKEYPNKKIEMKINLNEWGVYIVTLKFKDKKKKKVNVRNKPHQPLVKDDKKNIKNQIEKKENNNTQIKFIKHNDIKKQKKFSTLFYNPTRINQSKKKIKSKILNKISKKTNTIKENIEKNIEKKKEEYYDSERKYGKYKETKSYKPY